MAPVLRGIPAEDIAASEPPSLRAWFAAQRNDPTAERSALEQLIAVEPGNTPALDRLAALAQQAGDLDRAAALRRRQEETLRDKDRYRRLMIENRDPIPRDELHERARLAERLGRWYEAQGWLTLALEREPADRAARDALDRLARDAPRSITLALPEASLLDLVRESGDPMASGPRSKTAAEPLRCSGSARVGLVPRRCRGRRALLHLRQRRNAATSDPRDDRRGRRRARLRRRWLARRLSRSGRPVPSRGPTHPGPGMATACSATAATARSRM